MLDVFSTANLKSDDNQSKNHVRVPNSNLYECVLFQKPSFVILSSLGSFYIPCVIMLLLYAKVFLKIRQQTKSLNSKKSYSLVNHSKSLQTTDLDVDHKPTTGRPSRYMASMSAGNRVGLVFGGRVELLEFFLFKYFQTKAAKDPVNRNE
jgi:hypothetical protein